MLKRNRLNSHKRKKKIIGSFSKCLFFFPSGLSEPIINLFSFFSFLLTTPSLLTLAHRQVSARSLGEVGGEKRGDAPNL